MWYLTSNNDQRVMYFAPGCQSIVIGRSPDANACNFPILNDPSISRIHAMISISEEGLILQDLDSKYHTFVNNKTPVLSKTKILLKEADIVHFGQYKCIWEVKRIEFVTCSSTLKGENLQNLNNCLEKLGGLWLNNWEPTCNYLTMPAITLTIKVVLAMVQGSHIVTPSYWNECCKAVRSNGMLPDPKQFTPHVLESTLNSENVSFHPDNRRKDIFKGKRFVFFTRKQFEMYGPVIIKASGTPVVLSESKFTKQTLCSDNVIVVQYITQDSMSVYQVNDITNYLKTHGKRVVSDVEIGLAVLHSSTAKHCNPDFSVTSEVMRNCGTSSEAKQSSILAKDTQDIDYTRRENVVIDESLTEHMENSHKRKLTDDLEIHSVKRMATANDDDEELFNFVDDESKKTAEKKLNFAKPQKRKAECADDDDLFNFLPGNKQPQKPSAFNKDDSDGNEQEFESRFKKPRLEKVSEFVKPVQGIKAKELGNNTEWKTSFGIKTEIKEEAIDDAMDLGQQLQNLDLGSTVIEINLALIKEEKAPHIIQTVNGNVKNFKTFKKVWPLKMKVIPEQSPISNISMFDIDAIV